MPEQLPLHEAAAKAGATFTEDAGFLVPAHFGDSDTEMAQARSGAVLFDLSHRGKLEVAGNDAVKFLHNLSSNDVKGLAPDTGCEAFFCTATAKVIAHALLYRCPPEGKREKLALDVAPGLSAKVMKHLDRHLISEDVEFADRTRDLVQFHLAGPAAPALLGRLFGSEVALSPLQQQHASLGGADWVVRRHDPLGLPGFDVLGPLDRAEELWLRLREEARPAGRQAYEVLRIEAGTPLYGADVDETTFAPEVARTRQAISYGKGCYLGQEPIVMARDRGQVNRALLGLKLPDGPVPAGALLFRDGKEVGRVTSSVLSPRLGAIALAYVRRGSQAAGTVLEVETAGQRKTAVVAALPF